MNGAKVKTAVLSTIDTGNGSLTNVFPPKKIIYLLIYGILRVDYFISF